MKKLMMAFLLILSFANSDIRADETKVIDVNYTFDDKIEENNREIDLNNPTNLIVDENGNDLSTKIFNYQTYDLKDIEVSRKRQKIVVEYYLGDYISKELIGSDKGYADYDDYISLYLMNVSSINSKFNTNIPDDGTHKLFYLETPFYRIPTITDGDEPYTIKILVAKVHTFNVRASFYQNQQDKKDSNPIGQLEDDLTNTDYFKVRGFKRSHQVVLGQKISMADLGNFKDTNTASWREGILKTTGYFENDGKFVEANEIFFDESTEKNLVLGGFYHVDDYGEPVKFPGYTDSWMTNVYVGSRGTNVIWKNRITSELYDLSDVEKLSDYPLHSNMDPFDEPEFETDEWFPENWFLNHKIQINYRYVNQNNFYTVSFDEDGIDPIENIQEGKKLDLLPEPGKEGHRFTGWYKDKSLNEKWDLSEDRVKEDTMLYAGWDVDTYTVDFDSLGGSEVDALIDIAHNSKLENLATPSKEGHTFTGWYQDKDLIEKWDESTDRVLSNMTLYAGWRLSLKVDKKDHGISNKNLSRREFREELPISGLFDKRLIASVMLMGGVVLIAITKRKRK